MAAMHGGKRTGAGRPRNPSKTVTAPGVDEPPPRAPTSERYEDALAYLEAVVRGDLRADPLRVAAARIILPFQRPKQRAPVESPAPKAMRAKAEREIDDEATADFQQRAEAIRKRHAATKGAK